jgi:23S rRNA (pseudouridine1915-N3)-methyltransferase
VKIKILLVGKIRNEFIRVGVQEYRKRLLPFFNIDIEYLQNFSDLPKEIALSKEGEIIKKIIKDKKYIVSLDKEGKELSSEEFAYKLLDLDKISQNNEIIFIIGGIHGIQEDIKKSSNFILSLSKMTFTHEFALLILLEQIYRGIKILRNEPYHY